MAVKIGSILKVSGLTRETDRVMFPVEDQSVASLLSNRLQGEAGLVKAKNY